MGNSWEYKVLTLKREKRSFLAGHAIPDDQEATNLINREGMQGWELVSAASISNRHAIHPQPLKLFFKRPR